MKKLIPILLCVIIANNSGKAQNEVAIDIEISSKIQIFYLPDPAKPQLSFKAISLKKISEIGDKYIFGENDNNGMSTASSLLAALIKHSLPAGTGTGTASRSTKPDLRFKEAVYHALKLADKPIKIFFVRDLEGLQENYLKTYNVYYKKDLAGLGYIWPGSFTDIPPFAGNIMMGERAFENLNLDMAKRVLLSLIVQIGLKDFGPAKTPGFIDFPTPAKGVVKLNFAVSDIRRIENQAIANAFLLHYSPKMRQVTYNWANTSFHFTLPISEAELGMFTTDEGQTTSLQRYSLRDKFKSMNAVMVGSSLTGIPGIKDLTKNWVYYNADLLGAKNYKDAHKYLYQTDLYLGFLYYQFIRSFGIARFVEAIRYENSKLLTIKPGDKTLFLFQNMALLMLNGKTAASLDANPESKEAREAIYPLAVLSFFGGGGYEKTLTREQFKSGLAELTSSTGFKERGEFNQLIDFFLTRWRSKISVAITSGPSENDNDYIVSRGAKLARILQLD